MCRFIVLLLITGNIWAQTNFDSEGWISKDLPTDFDKLVLKNGIEYIEEHLKRDFSLYTYNLDNIDQEIIYFKPLDVFAFQPVPVDLIKVLKLKDGTFFLTLKEQHVPKKTIMDIRNYFNRYILIQ